MIEFKNLTGKKIGEGVYKSLYKKIFKNGWTVSVVWAEPRLMRSLNAKFRGQNKPTNVLSFLLQPKIGEIFINSREKQKPFLFVHGALHLLGHNHKKIKNARNMEKLEKKILKNNNE